MANLQDVARAAKVSVSTVSRALSGGPGADRISEECVRRVRRAAEKIGYRANYHARSLQTGRADAIGLVIGRADCAPETDGYLAAVLVSVETQVRASGRHMVTVGASGELSEVESGLRFLAEGRIDGLLVLGGRCSPEEIARLEGCRSPVVIIEPQVETSLPAVVLKEAAGVCKAVEHLAEQGHRRLLYAGLGAEHMSSPAVRLEGFRGAVQRLGLHGQEILVPDAGQTGSIMGEMDEAHAVFSDYFSGDFDCTAIICFHDLIALAACAALREKGLSVPEDVSVVGFDDVFAVVCRPPLTCVSHMLTRMADRAVSLLFEMDADERAWMTLRSHREEVEPELVVRASTAPRLIPDEWIETKTSSKH
jgi:LacI family transcriptional regulator